MTAGTRDPTATAVREGRHAAQLHQPVVGGRRGRRWPRRVQRPGAGVHLRRLPEADHGGYGMAAGHRIIRIVVRRNLLRGDRLLGRMMDRWSIRRVALPGLVVYAFAMCLLGLSPKSLVIFTLLFALAEAASAVQTPIGYAKAISAWFDRRRGLALGIAMSGVGLGGFIMPQLAQTLIERVGWRGAYPILGLLTLAIAFPLVALWIREPRPGEGERRAVTAADATGLTARGAAGTRRFWLMGVVFFLVAVAVN